MTSIGERIRFFRNKKGLSQQDLSNQTQISRTYVSTVEAGRQDPSFAFIKTLSTSYNLSIDWLLSGNGKMFMDESSDALVNTDTLINSSIAKLENGIFCSKSTVYVPVSSITACCGSGITIYPQDYDINETIAVNRRDVGPLVEGATPFAVQTQGRSMEGYGIKDGSIVIVNPAEQWTTGTVVLVAINEKASIKKVYERSDGIDLVSSLGDKLHISGEDLRNGDYVRICGKVMLVISPPEHGV